MSPAKRKVAASRRAGARKPAAQKGRGKARPAAHKARSAVVAGSCDMPTSKLAAAFDRPEAAAPLLSHVPGCGACTTSLTVLAASGQGLKYLTADGAGTAVERVLARGQAQGQKKLADLVYELVKACLVVVQDVDRRLYLEQRPRKQAVIDREVRGVVMRLPRGDRARATGLLAMRASEDRALIAAQSCLQILEQVEGHSPRQRLSEAVLLICNGQPHDAEVLLRSGLRDGFFGGDAQHAYNNLSWALNRQRKFADVLELGQSAGAQASNEWLFVLNLAVASAIAGKRDQFLNHARKLKSLHSRAKGLDFERQEQHLRFEVPRFAEKLRVPEGEMATTLGVSSPSEAAATDATW